jgi:acetyl esterase/lipase
VSFYRLISVMMVIVWMGCAGDESIIVELEPDASQADSRWAERGEHGVAVRERAFRARVDERVRVRVSYPADARGELMGGGWPLIVFVPGGFVGPERYQWLMTHLASRGAVVVAADHALGLALLSAGDSLDALEAVRRASGRRGDWLEGAVSDGPALILGHSLGGVVSATLWLERPDQLKCVALLASEPNPSSDFSTFYPQGGWSGSTILSVTGERDDLLSPAQAREGVQRMQAAGVRSVVAQVDGMNHYQWTQDYTVKELERDQLPTVGDMAARRRAMFLVDGWVDACLGRDASALFEQARWAQGLTAL